MMKVAYLTFDDGPLQGTRQIVSLLEQKKVHGTMFMVGAHVDKGAENKSWLDAAKNSQYSAVGNHSYSHANDRYQEFYSAPEKVLEDFEHSQKLLGIKDKIARLPGRNMWQVGSKSKYDISSGTTSAQLLHKNGYTVFGWDVEWQNGGGAPVESPEVIANAMDRKAIGAFTTNHVVLLSHDPMFRSDTSLEKLSKLITLLQDRGFSFATVLDYPSAQAG